MSEITRFALAALITPARFAASIVSAISSSRPASPSRFRQRVRLAKSIGGSVYRYVLPVNTCQYGLSTHRRRPLRRTGQMPLQIQWTGDQPGRCRRSPLSRYEAFAHHRAQPIRVDQLSQPYKRMFQIDLLRQRLPEEISLPHRRLGTLSTSSEFAGLRHQ